MNCLIFFTMFCPLYINYILTFLMLPEIFKKNVSTLTTRNEITVISNDITNSHLVTGTIDGKINIYNSDMLHDNIKKLCKLDDVIKEENESKVLKEPKFKLISSSPTKKNNNSFLFSNLFSNKTDTESSFTFTSHGTEFDYLESSYISEKIVCIENFDLGNGKDTFIVANEKDIKIWSVWKTNTSLEQSKNKINCYDSIINNTTTFVNKNLYNSKKENESDDNLIIRNTKIPINENEIEDKNEIKDNNKNKDKNGSKIKINNKNKSKDENENGNIKESKNKSGKKDNNEGKNKNKSSYENENKEENKNKSNYDNENKEENKNKSKNKDIDKNENDLTIKEAKYRNRLYREYKNTHQYSLSGIKTVPRTSQILSFDFLRINLYDLEYYDGRDNSKIVQLIDIKPNTFNELQSVITSMKPKDSFIFAYGTSKGSIHFQDLRLAPRSKNCLILNGSDKKENSSPVNNYDFEGNNVLESASDFEFYNENYLLLRNMKEIKLYDIRNLDVLDSVNLLEASTKIQNILYSGNIYEKLTLKKQKNILYTNGYFGNIDIIEITDKLKLKKNEEIKIKNMENTVIKAFNLWDDYIVVGDCNKLHFYK